MRNIFYHSHPASTVSFFVSDQLLKPLLLVSLSSKSYPFSFVQDVSFQKFENPTTAVRTFKAYESPARELRSSLLPESVPHED